jgi:hypothetical protein
MKYIVTVLALVLSVSVFSQETNTKAKKVETSYKSNSIRLNTEIKTLNRNTKLYLQFAESLGLLNDELLILEDLKIYPNPNHGEFTLEFREKTYGLIDVFVYDLKGKVLFQEQVNVNDEIYSADINIENAAAGVYFLLIKRDNASLTQKIEKL